MMRTPRLLVAAAVVLFILCAAPVVMGFVIERVYSELIDVANRRAEGAFSVVGEFEQGLWTSSATTRVAGLGEADPEPMVLHHQFIHGPVPLGELSRGRWPLAWVFTVLETRYRPEPEASAERLGEESLLESVMWIHFDRSTRLRLAIAEWEVPGAGFSFSGLWGEAETNESGHFSARMTLGRAVLGEDGAGVLEGATLSVLRTPLDDGLETVEMTLDLGELELAGTRFGAGEIVGVLRRVDLGSAMELNAALSLLDESDLPEEQALLARAEVLGAQFPRLFRGSPELEISKLSLSAGSEGLNGRGRIHLDGSDPALLANPLFVMGLIQADAEMAVSEAILEKAVDGYMVSTMAGTEEAEGLSEADLLEMASFMREAVLGTLLAQKRIVREEGEFRLEMRFDGGLLILNGEMIDPAELSSPM